MIEHKGGCAVLSMVGLVASASLVKVSIEDEVTTGVVTSISVVANIVVDISGLAKVVEIAISGIDVDTNSVAAVVVSSMSSGLVQNGPTEEPELDEESRLQAKPQPPVHVPFGVHKSRLFPSKVKPV